MNTAAKALRLAAILWLAPLVAGCFQDDGGYRARAAEMRALSNATFKQVGGSCEDPAACAQDEAGFAYAKRAKIANPDDCPKASEDFNDGCQKYGDAVQAAVEKARRGS
jgi:hypothetical protein